MIQHGHGLTARGIVEEALNIAADICIYTNHHTTILELDAVEVSV
jgi:ATP-dependent HslUV protease subunit HslV